MISPLNPTAMSPVALSTVSRAAPAHRSMTAASVASRGTDAGAAPVDRAKVAALRDAIAGGHYTIDADAIARAMIASERR